MDIAFNHEMRGEAEQGFEIEPGVVRLLASNASTLTFKGTNTYLVGTNSLAVIDPGPIAQGHIEAIVKAAAGRPISDIVLTHRHIDHTEAIAELAARTGARTHAFVFARPRPLPEKSGNIDSMFVPDNELADGGTIEGDGFRLLAIHTPGHAPDHLCFDLLGSGIVFSGDHIMGWNTTVIAPPEGHMGDYFASLERLVNYPCRLYLPGHGEMIEEPQRMARAYIVHRRIRETAILEALRQGTEQIPPIVAALYRTADQKVAAAASLSVFAHLLHLRGRGLVSCSGEPGLQSRFFLMR